MNNGSSKRSRSPAVSSSAQAAAAAAALFANGGQASGQAGLPASLALSLLSAHQNAAAAAAAVQQQQQQATGTTVQDKRNRNPNWTDPEIIRFLEMLEEDQHVADMVANKNKKVFCEIAARLVSEGADKTWDQCRIKLKNLKSQYRYVKERIPYIDDLDLEDENVVKQLLTECQARAISPSSIKHLRFLLRFLCKLKMMTAMSAAGEMKPAAVAVAGSSSSTRSGLSLSNQLPPPTLATIKPSRAIEEGISPPSSPYPIPQIVASNGQENGDDNDPSYKMMEQFNRDLMEKFLEHQRKTRESFEKWEADRWRQEKEAIQKWKVESREHERALFDMFCNAMVKCNAALTAIFQAAKTSTSQSPGLSGHSTGSVEPRLANLIKRTREAASINHEVTIKRIRRPSNSVSAAAAAAEDDGDGDDDDDEEGDDDDDDDAYEMQQEIQNMVQVTMDVQDSEIVQC